MKNIILLGATGSIGTQTCDVARRHGFRITALSGHSNVKLLEELSREFSPLYAVVGEEYLGDLKTRLGDTSVKVVPESEIHSVAAQCEGDTVLNAVTGIAGLRSSLAVLDAGKTLCLANKESMVTGGDLVNAMAKKTGAKILPVDSEHSAIFQCLDGNKVKKILLTASGGPFYGKKREFLDTVTPEDALAHPTWNMGKKITIDSATLMNKGLELIEAVQLFGVSPDKIEVLVHRQSIVHSMVQYEDNAVLAQCGAPDMRTCIQYALTYPERKAGLAKELDFASLAALTFARPDEDTFTLLPLCRKAITRGGNLPAAVNGANEAAVDAFLRKKIGFTDIFRVVERAYEKAFFIENPTVEDIFETDREARRAVAEEY
ncbi:MAG: 1-deoxy-D-xylulose-5-phosphate reductoisomerase [Clostridia bacterium]|nr:1-deoxy-D-xylulose-5-phosphate reductoisomerase [Clostridia bacterium]